MIKKRGISLLLSAVLVFSLCGCGQKEQVVSTNSIELLEPVNVANKVEKAAYRNIYDCEVFSATVYPEVEEYSFKKNMTIDGTGVYWGETVKKGDGLIYGNTEKQDEEIEKMEERIANLDEAMQEATDAFNENLPEDKEDLRRRKEIVDNFIKNEPPQKIAASQLEGYDSATSDLDPNEQVDNPAYGAWKGEYELWNGKYRLLKHDIDMREESYRQRKELYDLERDYLVKQLEALKADRKSSIIIAGAPGEVVAKKTSEDNQTFEALAEQPLVAVADMDKLVLKSDYVNDNKAAAAKEMYALIDGVRYEIEYHSVSREEYTKITEGGGKVYSTFTFLGDYSNVEVGDFAVIVVFKEKQENVLTVPKEAVHKDSTGNFVYLMENDKSIAITVKTGITDGVYTEILSGLTEGDEVLVEKENTFGNKTASVTYGSFEGKFEGKGKIDGAQTEVIYNPIEYGTTYFGEYQVQYFQHVEKGDVIATIRVAQDDIAIQRNRQKLKRAQERLEDLKKAGEEENEDAIEAKLEEIEKLEEVIAEMEADAKTTEIKATASGMIVGMSTQYEKEMILYKDTPIVEIANETSIYISVENTNQLLNYDDEVKITFSTQMDKEVTSVGRVVSLGAAGLSKDLQSDRSMIEVKKEDMPLILMAKVERYDWREPQPYSITAKIREMNNVLVVPKGAVTDVDGTTYVNVMDEQGNVKACSFIAGGYDDTNYWVIEGLSEGMVICLK